MSEEHNKTKWTHHEDLASVESCPSYLPKTIFTEDDLIENKQIIIDSAVHVNVLDLNTVQVLMYYAVKVVVKKKDFSGIVMGGHSSFSAFEFCMAVVFVAQKGCLVWGSPINETAAAYQVKHDQRDGIN